MNSAKAAAQLGALANETRLDIVRLLVPEGRKGLSAGAIGEAVNLPASRLSFHLSALENAGLIWKRRESRNVIYAVQFPALRKVFSFLMDDCCGAHPSICKGLEVPEADQKTGKEQAETAGEAPGMSGKIANKIADKMAGRKPSRPG